MDRLRRVFQLTRRERFILAQAWGLFLLVDLALRMLPFKYLRALCQERSLRTPAAAASERVSVARLAWLVDVAGRYAPARATCLEKALVLSWLLGRRGVATALRIGVARRNGSLVAHAWLEREGQVIPALPEGDGYYQLFPVR